MGGNREACMFDQYSGRCWTHGSHIDHYSFGKIGAEKEEVEVIAYKRLGNSGNSVGWGAYKRQDAGYIVMDFRQNNSRRFP